jgi:hypothetical protein
MCNFCCKFASDFNMRGPIGRAEPYRTLTLQDGWKPTGRLEAYRTGGALQDC